MNKEKAMFHKGATAVTASAFSGYFVAVQREGIFIIPWSRAGESFSFEKQNSLHQLHRAVLIWRR